MAMMTAQEKVIQLESTAAETQAEYAKAMELYEDEPNELHAEHLREARNEYNLAKKWLRIFRHEAAQQQTA